MRVRARALGIPGNREIVANDADAVTVTLTTPLLPDFHASLAEIFASPR